MRLFIIFILCIFYINLYAVNTVNQPASDLKLTDDIQSTQSTQAITDPKIIPESYTPENRHNDINDPVIDAPPNKKEDETENFNLSINGLPDIDKIKEVIINNYDKSYAEKNKKIEKEYQKEEKKHFKEFNKNELGIISTEKNKTEDLKSEIIKNIESVRFQKLIEDKKLQEDNRDKIIKNINNKNNVLKAPSASDEIAKDQARSECSIACEKLTSQYIKELDESKKNILPKDIQDQIKIKTVKDYLAENIKYLVAWHAAATRAEEEFKETRLEYIKQIESLAKNCNSPLEGIEQDKPTESNQKINLLKSLELTETEYKKDKKRKIEDHSKKNKRIRKSTLYELRENPTPKII